MDKLEVSLSNIFELQEIYKLLEPYPNLLTLFQEILVMKNQDVATYVSCFETSDSDCSDSDSEFEGEASMYQSD